MTPFGIAGIQMQLQHGNNVDAIEERIDVLMSLYPWVEMVVLSELAAHGPLHSYAEPMPGVTEERFCEMARKHNIWLIPGSFFELRDDKVYNTAPVINPQGEVIARHSKLFPFCPFEEGVEAGDKFVVFDVPGAGRFGVCICYDMWFPEVLRTLTAMGAEAIIHPVLTGTNDRSIELNLARSSGALFQSYIIDINGLGVGGVGKSCLIDPSGRVIHQAGETNEYLVTELDFDQVRRQRETGLRSLGQTLKSFRDSKIDFDVYQKKPGSYGYLDGLGPMQKPSRDAKSRMAPAPVAYEHAVAEKAVAEKRAAMEAEMKITDVNGDEIDHDSNAAVSFEINYSVTDSQESAHSTSAELENADSSDEESLPELEIVADNGIDSERSENADGEESSDAELKLVKGAAEQQTDNAQSWVPRRVAQKLKHWAFPPK